MEPVLLEKAFTVDINCEDVMADKSKIVSALRDVLIANSMLDTKEERITGAVFIASDPGCLQQAFHTDYDIRDFEGLKHRPRGVLVALQADTKFITTSDEYKLSRGDVLVFDGGLVHAGAAYDNANVRIHLYVDPKGFKREKDATYFAEDVTCG